MKVEIKPLITKTLEINKHDVKGYLVIDKLINGGSFGGVRIIQDPYLEEMIAAARTMTHKFAFAGFKSGGAKAAVQIPPGCENKRAEILREFGKQISELIETGIFSPGIDMGCTLEDLQHIFAGAGVKKDLSSWKNISHIYTAWTVYLSTLAALKSLNMDLNKSTYVIEGFGNVGSEYAKLMRDAGARLIATSTRFGAIFNEKGIDVNEILSLRTKYKNKFILHYEKGKRIPLKKVLESNVDIAVPCARAWTINEDNYHKIKAQIIPCAANVAMDAEIERKLHNKGKIVITDFVSNCGGVYGSMVERQISREQIWSVLKKNYYPKIEKMIEDSKKNNETIAELALKEIEASTNSQRKVKKQSVISHLKKIPFSEPIKNYFFYLYYRKRHFL